jgi:hypothetical protein
MARSLLKMETKVFTNNNVEIFPDSKGDYHVALGSEITFQISRDVEKVTDVYMYINSERSDYTFNTKTLEIKTIDNFFSQKLDQEIPIRFVPCDRTVRSMVELYNAEFLALLKGKMLVTMYAVDRDDPCEAGGALPCANYCTLSNTSSKKYTDVKIFQAYFLPICSSFLG